MVDDCFNKLCLGGYDDGMMKRTTSVVVDDYHTMSNIVIDDHVGRGESSLASHDANVPTNFGISKSFVRSPRF